MISSLLVERQGRNAAYSLRAFARDLGLSASRLSEVLSAGGRLSPATARRIAPKLRLSQHEERRFCALVELESPDAKRRKRAAALLARLSGGAKERTLAIDTFALIRDWQHFAVWEAMSLEAFDGTLEFVAAQLRLPPAVVQAAAERLVRLGLAETVDGGMRRIDDRVVTTSGVPSEAIRAHHEQILGKAVEALHFQEQRRRNFEAHTFAIDPARMPEMVARIYQFIDELDREFSAGSAKKDVYCFATQLFSLKGDVNAP
jgi:uncharacterized protein (TIGR02147 family)